MRPAKRLLDAPVQVTRGVSGQPFGRDAALPRGRNGPTQAGNRTRDLVVIEQGAVHHEPSHATGDQRLHLGGRVERLGGVDAAATLQVGAHQQRVQPVRTG